MIYVNSITRQNSALTPLIEEPCDKKWAIFSVEWSVQNVKQDSYSTFCTLHSTLYYQILANFTGYVCLAFH